MNKFVILTTQRSGSTLLWRYLNEHPNITAHGEMMLRGIRREDSYATFMRSSIRRRLEHYLRRKKALYNYFDKLFTEKHYIHAAGFKLMYNQISKYIDEWITHNNIFVIHLIRENILKMFLSRKTAEKRNVYHLVSGQNVDKVKVEIEPNNILKELDKINSEIESYKNRFTNNPYIEVKYEDLQDDIVAATRPVFQFLNIKDVGALKIPLKKINPDSVRDLIQNYEEIKSVLVHTKYAYFLD